MKEIWNESCILSPSLICLDMCNLEREVKTLEKAGIKMLHVDILDGHFSPSMPLGLDTVRQLRAKTDMFFDCHVMVTEQDYFVDELLDIWKSACGFEMDTYSLEERILSLLMFTADYREEGEKILKSYISHSGKEQVIGAYLTQMAYGMFVKGMPETPCLREYLKICKRKEWPTDRICDLELLKILSEEKASDEEELALEEEILASCVKDDMVFEFFHDLDQRILRPYQLDDKTFVEYHASPETSVTLYYLLDTGLGTMPEYKSEPLRNVYEGIFTKTFTLFYGETLHYYFQTEDENGVHRTEEKMLTMNLTDDRASSKYQLINQILCARKLEKDPEVKEKLSQYLRQEQYVNEMFVIEKEPER